MVFDSVGGLRRGSALTTAFATALASACGRSTLYTDSLSAGGAEGVGGSSGAVSSGGRGGAESGGSSNGGRGGSGGKGISGGNGGSGADGGRGGTFGKGGAGGSVGGAGGSLGGAGGSSGSPEGGDGNEGGLAEYYCGNGLLDPGEFCDDGNEDDDDGCVNCRVNVCGDGVLHRGEEACDDDNTLGGDGCSAACRLETYGFDLGYATSCAWTNTGRAKCWGTNPIGQLGVDDRTSRGMQAGDMGENLPFVALDELIVQVGVGAYHACALLEGGRVKCWGGTPLGEPGWESELTLGDDPGEMASVPFLDLGDGGAVVELSIGSFHSCAKLADETTLKCWGRNYVGQLGLGDQRNRGSAPGDMGDALPPVELSDSPVKIRRVVAGTEHTCVILEDSSLKCWGDSSNGELGLGDERSRGGAEGDMGGSLPHVDLGTDAGVAEVALGEDFSCALLLDGRVKCWGSNFYGQLGLGDTIDRGRDPGSMGDALPAIDLGTSPGRVVQIAAGYAHACARFDDGRIKCWGRNSWGALGAGHTTALGGTPGHMGDSLPYVDVGGPAVAISAGAEHTCALLEDRTLKCWGLAGNQGVLGLGDAEHRGDDPGEMGAALPPVDLVY